MRWKGPFPFRGRVVWLTPEQGGRTSPPAPGAGEDYAATAFVPPWTVQTGLASFVVRAEWGAPVSAAEAGWLVQQPEDCFQVGAGTVVVVTEGHRVVAYFHVDEVPALL